MNKYFFPAGSLLVLILVLPVLFISQDSGSGNCSFSAYAEGGGCDCGSPMNKTPKEYPAPKDESGSSDESSYHKKKKNQDEQSGDSKPVLEPEEKEDPEEKDTADENDGDKTDLENSGKEAAEAGKKEKNEKPLQSARDSSEDDSSATSAVESSAAEKPGLQTVHSGTKSSSNILSCPKCGFFTNTSGACPKCGTPLNSEK